MKNCSMLVLATFAAFFSGLAAAADASLTTHQAATMKSSTPQSEKDAMVVKHDRMTKCKAMTSDEKAACEKQAKADAKKMKGKRKHSEGSSMSAKP